MTWHTLKSGEVKPSEHDIQCAVFDWKAKMINAYPILKLMVAYPSQGGHGKEAIIRGQIRKKEGQAKGFPDIMILAPKGKYHGAFLEVKREGERPRAEQKDWIEELKIQGYKAEWRAGLDECLEFICEYLGIKK